jgi:hypothetical protein
MRMRNFKRFFLASVSISVVLLTACDHNSKEWKTPAMTILSPRLQPMFEKSKPICFGRFMVDVPISAFVVWGETSVPLIVNMYPGGVGEVDALQQKFINELKSEKAIYLNDIPLLISIDDMHQPEGKIVTGYEGFEAIAELKINGYFKLNNDGFVINSRPLKEHKDRATEKIKSIAQRLRRLTENEIPNEPGNCIEDAFLPDAPNDDNEHPGELVSIGFRLKEFPDSHFSIQIGPSNPYDPERDSLKAQWKRIKEDPATPEEQKALASTTFFRESPREIHDWKTGYEVLTRSPEEDGSHSHHDFQMKFTGVPHDPFKPYADIQFQTGVADNAAGATKASLTDEEAIAVWDKITSTIRVRPTSAAPVKTAESDPKPQIPLGELAATGRTCPQTGWWQPNEAHDGARDQRQHIKAGDRMPHMVSTGEPSLWQKLKGEQPIYHAATVWKLVSYDEAPGHADMANRAQGMVQASTAHPDAKDGTGEGGHKQNGSGRSEG